MDQKERADLKKYYEETMLEDELINIGLQNPSEYSEGVYDLVISAIKKRNLEEKLNTIKRNNEKSKEENKWIDGKYICPQCSNRIDIYNDTRFCDGCGYEINKEELEKPEEIEEGKVVFTTSNEMEANLLKSLLESSNIKVLVVNGFVYPGFKLSVNIFGGIKLVVSPEQAEDANRILNEYRKDVAKDPNYGDNSPLK